MDASVDHLQKFTEVPFAVHAPATASGGRLAGAAAVALAGRTVRLDETRGVAPARYHAIVEALRAQIKAEVPPEAGYRIEVLDRTAPRDREYARIDGSLSKVGFASAGPSATDAMTMPFPMSGSPARGMRPDKAIKGCVLVGFPPDVDVGDMLLQATHGIPVPHAGITGEAFQKATHWHELGHCLLGASEARADTFSALMALRHGVYGKDQIATLAAWRELEEWTSPDPEDEHFIAASLWEVVARADALVADERFMAMSIPEVAGVAKAISDRYALGPDEIAQAKAVRRGIREGASRPVHYLRDAHGRRHATDVVHWGDAHSDVPEIARMGEVVQNLLHGARPMEAFRYDAKAMRAHLAPLVADGDPTARAMLAGLDRPAPPRRALPEFAGSIPYRFDTAGYAGRVLAMAGSARYAGGPAAAGPLPVAEEPQRPAAAPVPSMVMPAGIDEPAAGFGFGRR